MTIVVQKYGGTSVQNIERIKNVAQRINYTVKNGHKVVVVVSARSGVTNAFINSAIKTNTNVREMDMLLATGEQETIALTTMALQALGRPAISRLGHQAGFVTNSAHTRASLTNITVGVILNLLNEEIVVIVAGFQGCDAYGEITTLVRGGSDLSAIAIADALKAYLCQIFTDVVGILTADPIIVPNAVILPEIAYEEMLELASMGSKIMQTRAVEFALKYNVVFEVLSSISYYSGTIVKAEAKLMEKEFIRGVAIDLDQANITIYNLQNKTANIFQTLSEYDVPVDIIVHNGKKHITLNKVEAYSAKEAVYQSIGSSGGFLRCTGAVAKLSVVGIGISSHACVPAIFLKCLAKNYIPIKILTTSEIKLTVALDKRYAKKAAKVVNNAFTYFNSIISK